MKSASTPPGVDKPVSKRKTIKDMDLPTIDISERIMSRSRQRSGLVAGGTLLSSGSRQVTVAFTPPTFRKLKLAADKNGLSMSEMVRQCVSKALNRVD